MIFNYFVHYYSLNITMKKNPPPSNEDIKRKEESKRVHDTILFNTKTLNAFVNHNYRFRILVDEMIQLFYKSEAESIIFIYFK